MTAFHLDEYFDLEGGDKHSASFRNYLNERLFSQLEPKVAEVNYLDPDHMTEYGELLLKGPIHLACVGIGENGHIAFNDPPVADFEDKL